MESNNFGSCGFCYDKSTVKCAKCKIVYYCGKQCQRQHWKDHKKSCFPVPKPTDDPEYDKCAKKLHGFLSEMFRFVVRERLDMSCKPSELELYHDESKGVTSDWHFIIGHFLAKSTNTKDLKIFTDALDRFFQWDQKSKRCSIAPVTPLHWAINHKEMEFINVLPFNMIDLTYGCYGGYTAFSLACYHNMIDLVEKMINSAEKGAEFLNCSSAGCIEMCYTPLLIACEMGHLELIELLFKYADTKGINLNDQCTKTGYTALHLVCRNQVCFSGCGLGGRIDDNEEDDDKDDTIPNAVLTVKLFLKHAEEKKIRLFLKDKKGLTPFEVAISHGQVEIFKIFVEYFENNGIKLTDHGMNPLIAACRRTDELLWDEQTWGDCGMTYLERIEIIKILLQYSKDKEVNLFIKDDLGRSALHHACDDGFEDLLDLLIENGFNINEQDNEGRTPLHHASSISFNACQYTEEAPTRCYVFLRQLLSKKEELGLDVTIRDKRSQTALQAARKFVIEADNLFFRKSDRVKLILAFEKFGITDSDEEFDFDDIESDSDDLSNEDSDSSLDDEILCFPCGKYWKSDDILWHIANPPCSSWYGPARSRSRCPPLDS